MGKRRRGATRRKHTSSGDIRFAFALLVLAVIVIFVISVLVGYVRAADATGAAISAGLVLALLAVAAYSVVQKRRR